MGPARSRSGSSSGARKRVSPSSSARWRSSHLALECLGRCHERISTLVDLAAQLQEFVVDVDARRRHHRLQRRHFVVQRSPLHCRCVARARWHRRAEPRRRASSDANLFDECDPSGFCGASRFVFGRRAQRARNGFGLTADRCRFDFGLGDHVARTNIGVVEHARGFCLGFGHESRRLFLRLGDGCVGGALREHERAPQDVFGFAATGGSQRTRFGTLGAFDRLHQATLQLGDRFGPALLVVLYFFFVVPAERFVERRLTNELRRNVHRAIVPPPAVRTEGH